VLRLYQWLSERASFFRYDAAGRGTRRTVRTETTVRREGLTLLVASAAASFDICPLCGNKRAPDQASPLQTQTIVAQSKVGSINHRTIGNKVAGKKENSP